MIMIRFPSLTLTIFQYFVRAINSGDFRDFRDTPLVFTENYLGNVCEIDLLDWKSDKAKTSGENGAKVTLRAWESQSTGNSYDLEGPDAQSVTMPPAPKLGSEELTAEKAEIYGQAPLRDTPFNAMTPGVTSIGSGKTKFDISTATTLDALDTKKADVETVKEFTDTMSTLTWFDPTSTMRLNVAETARRRDFAQLPGNTFRGITPGDHIGPYLSQFLLAGSTGINGNDAERNPADGLIAYGAGSIDQRIKVATKSKNYLTDCDEWYAVQRWADFRGKATYKNSPKRSFIYTPRNLATYMHYDALYQAYLNACLLLLGNGTPFDPGIPFQESDNRDHQQGFAHFGGPHILSLVTEVAARALKAVSFQKYNVHRR